MPPIDTIGLVETTSVAKGHEAADAMLKTAPVNLLLCRSICSGKFLIAVSGDVASVQAGVRSAVRAAEGAIIEEGVITRLDPAVFPAIGQSVQLPSGHAGALGIVETFSAASVVAAADAAVKAAEVTLFRIHLAMALGGKGLAFMTGNLAAVESAVEAGARACEGMLVAKTVIPAPHRSIFEEYV